MKQPVVIRVFKDDQLQGIRQFTEQQIVIGCNEGVQLFVEAEEVSPLHAVIEERTDGYYVSDLGSSTGTYLNGDKILDQQMVSGQEIVIGPFRLQFFIGVPTPIKQNPESVKSHQPLSPPASVEQKPKSSPEIPLPPSNKSEEIALRTATPPPLSQVESVVKAEVTAEELPQEAVEPPPMREKSYRKRSTFAPGNQAGPIERVLPASKGGTLEVAVVWKDRVLSSYHFKEKQTISVGASPHATIRMPLVGLSKKALPLIKLTSLANVLVPTGVNGYLEQGGRKISIDELKTTGQLKVAKSGGVLVLNQGELLRLDLPGDTLSLFIRYVPDAPKPMVAPILDVTSSEVTGVILAVVVSLIFALYMLLYAPTPLQDQALLEEPLRRATVKFNIPKQTKAKLAEVTTKKIVKVKEAKTQAASSTTRKGKSGQAAEVAPKKTNSKKKAVTSAKSGGAIKTGKEGANLQSEKPDPTKSGLLGVFAKKGRQESLDKAYSGAGQTIGMADRATGFAGQADDREGSNIGTKLKADGAGGLGTSTVGISGVGTKGRGTGAYGYGTGGIGKKGSVDINLGGAEENFEGTIDREAIRQVIRRNYRAIKSCYELALRKDPGLYGKIVLTWLIGEKGVVLKPRIDRNEMGNKEVASCVVNRLQTWRFPEPPPDQLAEVTFPFVFSSQ